MTTKNEKRAAWREANRERIRAYDRARYAARPEKVKARAAAWHKANPDRVRENRRRWAERNRDAINAAGREYYRRSGGHRRKTLGVTPEAFSSMLSEQGGACAVCRTGEPGKKGWAVDHCHDTGRVRGVLCNACNLSLGLLQDDPARIRAAADYVERHAALHALL